MEQVTLDPVEVATGRTELDITAWIDANEGVDWGDADIAAYMADMERGSAPVDFRIPNRQITIPLVIKASGSTTFNQARLLLQHKVALMQREGGWIQRVLSSNTVPTGGVVYADVVNATLKLGGSWMAAHKNVDLDAQLTLETTPDWYGAEIQLADHVQTTNPELIWTETNILGNYPGRLRLVVDDDQGQNQRGLIWGIRSRHYSNSTTAQLRYNASTSTPLDAAGISGANLIHPSLAADWTPVMSTNQTGGVALTHTGTYEVWIRASCTAVGGGFGAPVRVRLLWDVGDFSLPAENAPVDLQVGPQQTINLGQVRLDRVPAGIHRWQGVIQAAGLSGGEQITIVWLWLVPVDEGYGVLRAPVSSELGLETFVARDEFNQTAGAATGKVASAGGSWAAVAGSDTDDFVVEATGHTLQRSAISDPVAGPGVGGRLLVLGPNTTSTVVQVDYRTTAAPPSRTNSVQMVAARVQSFNAGIYAGLFGSGLYVLRNFGGGSAGVLGSYLTPNVTANQWYTMRLEVTAAGEFLFWHWLTGGAPGAPLMAGTDTSIATGGALASGVNGIYDGNSSTFAATRNYNSFRAWPSQQDAVLFPGRSAELRTEGMFREDATGAAYGAVSYVVGDLPRIPPSGLEGRTVQFFVKASRGDYGTLPDTGIDDISARVTYRPSFLFVS